MFCKKCKSLISDEYKFCPECGKEARPEKRGRRREKGTGSILKLSGNRAKPYEARKDGVTIGTYKTVRDADDALKQYQGSVVTSLINITLSELLEKYKKTARYTSLSDTAKGNYDSAWKRMIHISSMKVVDIKAIEYQSCIDKVVQEGHERDTCEKVRSLISVLCQYAMKLEIMQKNYADVLELPTKVKNTQKRNFTYEEILTLFYNDHDDTAKIILCLIYTGVREKELFEMKKADVNIDKKYMVGGSKTEAGRNRIIPIRSEVIEYIEYFCKNTKGEYLISNKKGKKIDRSNFIKRMYYPLLDRLKINYKNEAGENVLTPYRTRHTFIAENIKAGVKPEILTKIVGHSNYSTSVDKYDEYIDIEYILSQIQAGM